MKNKTLVCQCGICFRCELTRTTDRVVKALGFVQAWLAVYSLTPVILHYYG